MTLGLCFSAIFVKKKKKRLNVNIPIIARVLSICIPSSLSDWFSSRSVSPISATCSPGNNRFTRRIRVELAVHASANCYWKKKSEKKKGKKKMAINRFRRLQIEMSCMPVPRRQATPSEPTLTWISVASSSFTIFSFFLFIYFFLFFCKSVCRKKGI